MAVVEIAQKDVQLDLKVDKPASVRGHAIFEPGGPAPEPDFGLSFRSLSPGISERYALVNSAGMAIDQLQPGSYQVRAAQSDVRPDRPDLPDRLFIQSIESRSPNSGSQNLLKENLQVLGGDAIEIATVDGVIMGKTNRAIPNATVALLPDDRSQTQRIVVTKSDLSGKFHLHCAPGAYHLYAWNQIDGAAYLNSEFMTHWNDSGTAVTVSGAGILSVQLRALDEE
jgi:hypothetical protein